jgi:hypothetical protein
MEFTAPLRRVIPVVLIKYKVSNMYNIQLEHNCVILSSIIQLVNYMFRPLNLAIIRFVLSLQRTVLHNHCV